MDREQLAMWLIQKMAKELKIPENRIDRKTPFSDYGLDSATEIALVGELNELLKVDLDPELFWDYPSIDELAVYLSKITSSKR